MTGVTAAVLGGLAFLWTAALAAAVVWARRRARELESFLQEVEERVAESTATAHREHGLRP